MPLPLRAALLAAIALEAAGPGRAGASPYTVAPPPAWIEPLGVELGRPARPDTEGGVDYLLVDDQVRAGPGERQAYRRLVKRVVSPKGIEDGSEVRVDFDPQYERLVFHGITLQRGDARLDALRAGEVKVIQREPELDRRLYDGRLTAVVFLSDVRVGDVIDVAWTRIGSNPVFEGRYAGAFELGYGVPVERLGVRVLLPEGRPLAWRTHDLELPPAVAKAGGLVEYRWRRERVDAFDDEGDLPPGVSAYPWLEVSEWGSWADVVRWALPLYAPGEPSAAMAKQLAAWRALPGEAQRATAALRFVQDQVRYLGIELGPSSHRPHRPAEVFDRRFGDCKDKALLLVTLYRALGIEAAPALVHTEDREAISARLPSPFAFDHVIVRARIGGSERWLEPTRSLEHAPTDRLPPPPYALALPVTSGAEGLLPIPEPPAPRLEVRSTWRVPRFGAPVQLEVVTTYDGLRALAIRHELAGSSPAELQRHYLDYYGHREPKIRAAAPLEVADDPASDLVTVTERYVLPPIAEGEDREFRADAIRDQLEDPATALRKLPLRIRHPVVVAERLRIELPGRPAMAEEREVLSSDAARLVQTTRVEPQAIVFDYEYRSAARSLPPGAVARHLATLRRMRERCWSSFPISVERPQAGSGDVGSGAATGILLVGLIAGALVLAARFDVRAWWADRRLGRRRRAFASRLEHGPGESPQLPLRVSSPHEMASTANRLRCGCGGPLAGPEDDGVRLLCEGREVIVHALACARCGARRRTYFAVDG